MTFSFSKVINDPVHGKSLIDTGHVEFNDAQLRFIDSPQFQRLRNLKQLGTSSYVFPGANHTRFEHSLGVCHLAQKLITRFQQEQKELDITDNDVLCVSLAGLCHDLGHGPFSHVFDGEFIKRARPEMSWTHEQGSEMMLDALLSESGIDFLSTDDVKFIKDLIDGHPRSNYANSERMFLYEIVANKRNSMDVDKFDYIPRDCYYTGVKQSYDASRLMKFSRVIENTVGYNQKDAYGIYEMFHTRYTLHKNVYNHKTAKAIEYMMVDALLAANPVLGLSEAITDPEEYLYITDDIVREIERSKIPELAESQAILKRLRKRDLYRFVDQVLVPPDYREFITKEKVTSEAIVAHQAPGSNLRESDIIVNWLVLTYAMKDRNPVDNIGFYNKYRPDKSETITREQVSMLIPENYDEVTIRIFTRDASKRKPIQDAFRSLISSLNEQFKLDLFTEIDYLRVASVSTPNQSPVRGNGRATSSSPSKMVTMSPSKALTLPEDMAAYNGSPIKKRVRLQF